MHRHAGWQRKSSWGELVRRRNARRKRNRGSSHRPPKDNLVTTPAGRQNEKDTVYSLALNSTWILRGSVTDAVYGTPTDADRLLSEVT
jgi:hypothetical protein